MGIAGVDRRRLMAMAGAGALSGLAAGRAFAAGLTRSWPVGVQLWTLAAEMQKDVSGSFRRLKQIGIDVVETAGLYGGDASTLKAQLDRAGLTCRSCHVSLGDLADGVDKHIADAKTLGATWLVASSPKPPRAPDPGKPWIQGMTEVMTLDAYRRNAEIIANVAPKVAAADLTLGYHNHSMEFARFNGRTGLDILLAASPLTRLELDLCWVTAAGHNAARMITAYPGRVDLLHIKDVVRDRNSGSIDENHRSVEVGKGLINWNAVFEAAKAAKVQGYFIEQEAPFRRPVFDSLEMSVSYLKSL